MTEFHMPNPFSRIARRVEAPKAAGAEAAAASKPAFELVAPTPENTTFVQQITQEGWGLIKTVTKDQKITTENKTKTAVGTKLEDPTSAEAEEGLSGLYNQSLDILRNGPKDEEEDGIGLRGYIHILQDIALRGDESKTAGQLSQRETAVKALSDIKDHVVVVYVEVQGADGQKAYQQYSLEDWQKQLDASTPNPDTLPPEDPRRRKALLEAGKGYYYILTPETAKPEKQLTSQEVEMEENGLMEQAYSILTNHTELFESDKYELAEDTRCMLAELALARHLSESILGNTGIIQLYRRSVLRNYKEYIDKHPIGKGKNPMESITGPDGTSLYPKLAEAAAKAKPDAAASKAATEYIQAKFQTRSVPWNDQIGAVIAEGNMSELMATLYSVDMIPNTDPKLKAKLRKGQLKGSKLLNDRKLDKYFDEQPAAIGLMVDTTFGESTTEARQVMEKALHDLSRLFQETDKGGVIAAIRNGVRNFGGVFAMAITSSLKVLDEGVEPAQSAPQGHGG